MVEPTIKSVNHKEVNAFFVYGTLKRGQSRQHCWPAKPISIQPAWTWGHLYDGLDYPAMTAGDNQVIGELWCFDPVDVACVLQTLDRIEVTNQPGVPDLYCRETAPVFDIRGQSLGQAYVYLYGSDPEQDGFDAIVGHRVQWPLPDSGRGPQANRLS